MLYNLLAPLSETSLAFNLFRYITFRTGGAIMTALFLSFVLFAINIFMSALEGDRSGENPWDAGTLEWATSSPPPVYNFARIPVVTHAEPLWDKREALPVSSGLRVDARELLVSTIAHGTPDLREKSAAPSIWPLFAALSVGGTGRCDSVASAKKGRPPEPEGGCSGTP